MKHGNPENNAEGAGIERELHDPISDQLVPLEPLDLSRVRTVDDLVRAMAKTAFTGRQVGKPPTCWRPWRATRTASS